MSEVQKTEVKKKKHKTSAAHVVWTIIGALLILITIPILVINIVMIVQSKTNPNQIPRFGTVSPFIIQTDSMSPTIQNGDLIITKHIKGNSAKEGDVIVYYNRSGVGSAISVDRVVAVNKNGNAVSYIVKGDANKANNANAISEKMVISEVFYRVPILGNVILFMQTTPGLIICIGVPILLIVIYDAIRRSSYNKKHREELDELEAELEALKAKKAETESKNNSVSQ